MSLVVELSAEECLNLLRTTSVGRIGLVTPGGPLIFPVNFALSEDAIVFRTLPYGVIAGHAHHADVAFEVDSLDEGLQQGWSVLAVGPSERVEDFDEVRHIKADWDPAPWADGQRTLYFRIRWTSLTGRQVGQGDRPGLIPTSHS